MSALGLQYTSRRPKGFGWTNAKHNTSGRGAKRTRAKASAKPLDYAPFCGIKVRPHTCNFFSLETAAAKFIPKSTHLRRAKSSTR